VKSKKSANGVETSSTFDSKFVGAAIGYSSKSFHVEVGHEVKLKAPEDTIKNPSGNIVAEYAPTRSMVTVEVKWGKLTLGYIGNYYVDGFSPTEKIMLNQLVYENTRDEPRLENIFNFSISSDKGSTFSGSISVSDVKAKEGLILFGGGSDTKIATKTQTMGAALKYSYVF
jgi:hypothetical protein